MQLTPGALGASLMFVGLGVACAPLAPAPGVRAPATAPDAAIWVYGANRWTPDEQEAQLARFAAIAGRLYLSVEDGPRLLVDDPDGARRLGELLDRAVGRFGLAVEAMLLQDPSRVADPAGAVERVTRVAAFHAARRAAGRPGFAGLHFDIEPHSEEAWPCASAEERTATIRSLQGSSARQGWPRERDPRPRR